MKSLIASLALLGAMLLPQFTAAHDGKDCSGAKSVECDLVQKGIARKVIPNPDLVCVYFVQPKISNVLLWVFPQGGGEPRPYVKRNAGKTGQFCIGRHFVRDAEALFMCNVLDGQAIYPRADAVAIALKDKLARMPGEACLHGEGKCADMGYKPMSALSVAEKSRMDELRARVEPQIRLAKK